MNVRPLNPMLDDESLIFLGLPWYGRPTKRQRRRLRVFMAAHRVKEFWCCYGMAAGL